MKSIILLGFSAFLFTSLATSQPQKGLFGVWGYGTLNNADDLNLFTGYNIIGYDMSISWKSIEPAKDNYDFTVFDSKINTLVKAGKYIGIRILISPFNQNTPGWISSKLGVPLISMQKVNTNFQKDDTYPYYLDPRFIQQYFEILEQVANHLNTYPNSTKEKILYWMCCEGTTGDPGPYHGTPANPGYNIDDTTWERFRREAWQKFALYNQKNSSFLHLMFNAGNDGKEQAYISSHYPGAWDKGGILSHKITFTGEQSYFNRQNKFKTSPYLESRLRGEAQQFWEFDSWKEAPLKQSFILISSALAGGLDMFDITAGWIKQNTADPRPTNFFNKYGDERNPVDATKAFIVLRDVIDYADIIRFPPGTFGELIDADPLQVKKYTRRTRIINSADISDSYKDWLTWQTTDKFLNPVRKTKIQLANSGAQHSESDPQDSYHDDYIVGGVKNYELFISQINPDETSEGRYRIGGDTAMYGRFARAFKIINGQGIMNFRLDNDFASNIKGVDIKVAVTYFDSEEGEWSLNCPNGSPANEVTITNGTSNKWKTKEMIFKNVSFTNHTKNEADLNLRYIKGANTIFQMIEIEILKNQG